MAFLFSSSHLPASRVRRPDLEADDDHDENPEAMPRSGGVRASSHLEGRVAEPEAARSTGGSPAPRSNSSGIDWMGRLKELAEQQQQRRRADSAAPDSGPGRADEEHEPDAGAEHEDGAAPGDVHDEAPEHGEHDDTSSWYHPPESRSYHPDSGFNVRPEDVVTASPDHGFYQHPPESEERGIRDEWGDGAPPSAQERGVSRNDEGRSQPQSGQRGVGPDAPAGSGPASGRTGALPNSRLFEMRPHPALARMTGAGGGSAQSMLGGQARSGSRFQDYARPVAGPRNGSPSSFAAQAAPSSKEERPPQGQAPSQPQQGGATKQAPAPPPNTALAQTAPPPAKAPKENQPTFKVDPADESKGFMLKDPVTNQEYPSDRTFGDHARSIMQHEIDNSPTAKKLLEYITNETGKPVIIQMSKDGKEAHPYTAQDGSLVITVNPTNLRSGTLSHEVTHFIQAMALTRASQSKAGGTKPLADARKEASRFLNGLVKVMYDGGSGGNGEQDGRGDGENYQENEAMRAANIVNAELDAVRIRNELDQMKTTDRKKYDEIMSNPALIAAKFWYERRKNENVGHQDNLKTHDQGKGLPTGTRYGNYKFDLVNQILGLGEKHKVENSMPLN